MRLQLLRKDVFESRRDNLQLEIESLESRQMLATIQVFAAGTTGQESIDLQLGGQTVATFSNLGAGAFSRQFQTLTHDTAGSVSADDLRIRFTNDSFDSATGIDRNVRIDAIAVDGVRFETESAEVFSTGTWLPADGVQPGFRESEFLHVNGYFQYAGGGGNSIQVRARGTEGGEQFRLVLAGATVGTFETTTEFQTFTHTMSASLSPNDIRVEYFGDVYNPDQGIDTNLVVDFVRLNDAVFQTEASTTFSTGTWLPEDGVQLGFRQSETLHADGYFQYAAGGGSEVIVSASGDEGGEQFQLVIAGQVVQTFTVSTTFQNYVYNASNAISADQIRIEFINDVWNPAESIDTNLHVDYVTVDGVQYETEAASTLSTGTWTSLDGIAVGFGRGETLHVNGYFQFLAGNNDGLRVQAEAGRFSGSARFGNGNQNFDGDGYAEALNFVGDGVELDVNVSSAGRYDLDIRYAAGPDGPASDRTITLFVNGVREQTLEFSRTGDWSAWHNSVQDVTLQAGVNTIRFTVASGDSGAVNIDYVDVRAFAGRLDLGSTSVDLLDNQTTFSLTALQVRKLATLPTNTSRGAQATRRINAITVRPDDPTAVYTASQDGRVYRVSTSGQVSLFFDVDPFIRVSRQSSFHGGLRSIAFHPDFANASSGGFGKIYASLMADLPGTGASYIGNSLGNVDSVVAEFTYDFGSGQVVSSRELFRVRNPQFDHPIKDLSFNTAALPGDSDYGLLYIAHGDGSIFSANIGNGLVVGDALGKILRINPLPSGNQPYTTPGNIFAIDGDPLTLAEVYTWGHRNPHNLSFGRESSGDAFLVAAEIGQDSIEEVNLIRISNTAGNLGDNGRSYGWGDRTGTFEKVGFGYRLGTGVENLRLDDGGRDYVYPVIQIDHDDPNENKSIAIAGGPVINGRYFYGMFAGNPNLPGGQTYSVDVGTLLSRKTSFNPALGETTADLTFVDDNLQHRLVYNGQTFDTFAQLLSNELGQTTYRTDVRFAATADGRLIMTSKLNGSIYIIDNAGSLPNEVLSTSAAIETTSEDRREIPHGLAVTRRRVTIDMSAHPGEWIVNLDEGTVSNSEGTSFLDPNVRRIMIRANGSDQRLVIVGDVLDAKVRENQVRLGQGGIRLQARGVDSLQLVGKAESRVKLIGRDSRFISSMGAMQAFQIGQFQIELFGMPSVIGVDDALAR